MNTLFEETLRILGNIYRDVTGFDMYCNDFKDSCREAWRHEEIIILYTDRIKIKNDGKNCNSNENRNRISIKRIHFRNECFSFFFCIQGKLLQIIKTKRTQHRILRHKRQSQ